MTVIVYNRGVMASDSQAASRGYLIIGNFEKIGRREITEGGYAGVYLWGSSGDSAYQAKFNRWMRSDDFLKWLESREGGPQIEPDGKDDTCTGLVVMPNDSCVRFEGNYPWYTTTAPWYVLGSGEVMASGALAVGATAEEAVAACIKYDALTNGEVVSLKR